MSNHKYYIEFGFFLDENLGLKSVSFNDNTTDLPNNSDLLKSIAIMLLQNIHLNKEDVQIQDLLNELDIDRE